MTDIISSLHNKNEEEGFATQVEEALNKAHLADEEYSCVHALLVYVKAEQCKEFYVGGVDGSTCLLRVMCEEADTADAQNGLDIICEHVLPTEPVTITACVRRQAALNLIALFWRKYPGAPILVELGSDAQGQAAYGYVLCGIEGEANTWGPFDLNNWRILGHRDDNSKITFMTPKPQGTDNKAAQELPTKRRESNE